MAVQRFVLDSTTLDNSGFGLGGGAAFILDTSTLDGAAVLDGGEFLTVATGSSSLGGVSASASAQATIFPFCLRRWVGCLRLRLRDQQSSLFCLLLWMG